ncbi:hypothetical protein Sjap_024784 [Stephania japonica]|uniref:Uncharacterized protein n=1 Tax=Stephania japonica TaxID=461633 RepID=A0AAP0EIX5_9MAGN
MCHLLHPSARHHPSFHPMRRRHVSMPPLPSNEALPRGHKNLNSSTRSSVFLGFLEFQPTGNCSYKYYETLKQKGIFVFSSSLH